SAISPGNAARELFGSERDSTIQYGRLEQAVGGTLFLDEVADMDLEAQAQLVGALDTGSFMRVGGSSPVTIDVRLIAATQRDLHTLVEQGAFREDLFYQLNVVPLVVPPLREHREDIPELLQSAVDRLVEQDKLPYRRFSIGAQNVLRNHDWPGNIRELKNLVQRLLILGNDDEIAAQEVEAAMGAAQAATGAAIPGVSFDQPLRDARDAFEKAYLEYQLEKHGGNVSQMAEEAGMERTHLYRKLRDRGIEIKDRR
ncbi:MAG: sigma-54-dependent Fis family transcriptional regulator, partial [Gammaproteobacteria bacterium]|nr:sigma-54-dependent Fis family transcriptional regulator [Gammaproteobacteria bacterium]